jgi:very-short-patch-repair endonuclease
MANEFARHLRKAMTDAERFVWARIRYRQLGGYKFRRQAPIGKYIADFVSFEAKLIIELDGSQHAFQIEKDEARSDWLRSQGFQIIRLWNDEVFDDWENVMERIWPMLPTPGAE